MHEIHEQWVSRLVKEVWIILAPTCATFHTWAYTHSPHGADLLYIKSVHFWWLHRYLTPDTALGMDSRGSINSTTYTCSICHGVGANGAALSNCGRSCMIWLLFSNICIGCWLWADDVEVLILWSWSVDTCQYTISQPSLVRSFKQSTLDWARSKVDVWYSDLFLCTYFW